MQAKLIRLAKSRFESLTEAEHTLLAAIVAGSAADCARGNDDRDPAHAERWSSARSVRAKLLRWLCVDSTARAAVDVRGLHLQAAHIVGRLDLAFVTLPFPLALVQCAIPAGIDLTEAETRAIALDGSHCGPIAGAQMLVRGSLYLRDGFTLRGEARLLGATIKGSLECRGARFFNPDGDAISANGINVSGAVFMDNGFRADGTVRLVGASIGRMFTCSGGNFVNRRREALSADGISVGNSVLLDRGFCALGEVRLMGAVLHGDLSCRGGRIANRGGDALSADGITVSGSVNLNRGFRAIGRVRLVGATIKRDLTCRDSRFFNGGAEALVIDRARIEGNVYFDGNFRCNALISLCAARIAGDVHVWHAQFSGRRASGLSAENAAIAGKFLWKKVQLAPGTLLNLTHATVGQLADEQGSWPAPGQLQINGFSYGSIGEGPADAASRLAWLRRANPKPYHPQPYEQLSGVFRRLGQDEDAIRVAIAGEDARLKHGELDFSGRLRQWGMKYLLDYGYKPHYRALLLGAIVVALGWPMFAAGGKFELMSPTRERVYMDESYVRTQVLPEDYPTFNSLMYSIDAFIPFVDLHQEDYWLPNANRTCPPAGEGLPCGAMLRAYLWLHISLGWVLATLFAVGLTGLVRKE